MKKVMLAADEILRDRYRIIQLLGQGGMGAVYEAHDSVFDTSVAVKEIVVDLSNANNTKAQELVHAAFEREAKLLAKINHETFPHVKDYFSYDDRQFLIMELVDGEDLATLLKQRGTPFPVSDVLDWADQLLDGLDYLHKQTPPIIHRDLKPQNLKLNSRGKVKLLDFGIAKGTDTANANTVTDQTFVAATQNYSPIEQMLRVIDPTFLAVITHKYEDKIEPILEQSADASSDIYALGATLYNLLTAKSPVESVKRGIEVWDGKADPLENPNSLNPAIKPDLADWLLKSMQIRREHRFLSADEMHSALKDISTGITKQSAQKTEVMNFPPQQFPDTQDSSPVPTDSDANSVETIAAPQPLASSTAQNQPVAPPTAVPNVITAPGQTKKRSSLKFLWLIPVFGLLFMALGVAGFGAWWFLGRTSGVVEGNSNTGDSNVSTIADSTNSNSDPEPEPTLEPEPTEEVSLNPAETPETTTDPSPASTTKSTPKPAPTRTPRKRATPKPTVRRTPRPTPKKKPTPKPTRKKKNMDCIFTDDC